MTDAVLFDLFGVIAHHQSPAGMNQLAASAHVPAKLFWPVYWAARPGYDRGESGGRDYWAEVAGRLDVAFTDQQVAELISSDVASWAGVNEDMVGLLQQQATSTRLALLSNIPPEIAEHYSTNESWLDLFEVRAFSCQIGLAKPDPRAYLWCCDALELVPERVTFIDDRAENVAAAEAVGMKGHLFTSQTELVRHLGWDQPSAKEETAD